MTMPLSQDALEILFLKARTYHAWTDKPVEDALLMRLYDLMKMGPTSTNVCPARFVFVKSPQAKEKLKDALSPGNVAQTMAAPVTVIMAYDPKFYEKLDELSPQNNARLWFEGQAKEAFAHKTAVHNAVLQQAYFILAARACGLDCGPMAGFKEDLVDQAFFQGSPWRTSLLCNLGYGDPQGLYPRAPRLTFDQACSVV